MPELSTLLRQRLGATEGDPRHPDADVLTAYTEQLLPAPERDEVVKHLAMCSDCRQVVALSMPEAAEPQAEVAVATSAPRRRWFLSPAFGLAGSIAAVVLGVALILRLPQNTKPAATITPGQQVQEQKATAATAPPSTASQTIASDGQVANLMQQQPAPAAASSSQPKFESNTANADLSTMASARTATRVHEKRESGNSAPVFTAELRKQDYVNRMFLARSYETQAAVPVYRYLPQAPAPAQPNLVFAPPSVVAGSSFQTSGAFEVSSNVSGGNQGVITFYSAESHESTGPGVLGKIVDFGKRPLARRLGQPVASGTNATAMFKPGMAAQRDDAITAKSAQPAEAGVLAQSQAFSSNALAAVPRRQPLGAPQYQWKVVQGKLLRSSDLSHWTEENLAGESVLFSVVSSNGPEIWAGGEQAALVHSRDGGATWERITLGATATGTINSIEVAGQNIHVKSSSGQNWASQDGGKSWILQD